MIEYRLTSLDFAADRAAMNLAWASMLEKIRASDPGNLRRIFIDVSKLYTLETWNFTFLDTELLLCLCEVNHVLYANFYRFSQDQALLATEFARGMDLLVEAVGRRLARGPAPEDPSHAVALLRGLMGPSPAERYRTEDGWAVYWGDAHVHSAFSYDAFGSPKHCHEFGRQVAGFDFMCLTDHDFAFDSAFHPYFSVSSDRMFGLIADATQRASTPDFLALVGYEWGGRFAQGHRHVLFAPGSLPKFTNGYSVARESCASITRLFRQLCRDGVDALSIPHHTAFSAAGMGNALRWWNPDYERLIEVVSENGDLEWPGWELPLDDKGITMVGRTVTDALTKGMRLGILASSDNHTGTPGLYIEGKTGFGGKTGYAAVLARSASYGDIYDALKARRCYGTDGRKFSSGSGSTAIPWVAKSTFIPRHRLKSTLMRSALPRLIAWSCYAMRWRSSLGGGPSGDAASPTPLRPKRARRSRAMLWT